MDSSTQKQYLPMSMAVAAKCEAIDDVMVEPLSQEPCFAYRPRIKVLRIGNWRKRLINKISKHLTEHIRRTQKRSVNKPIFRVYILSTEPIKKGMYMSIDMTYDLQHN